MKTALVPVKGSSKGGYVSACAFGSKCVKAESTGSSRSQGGTIWLCLAWRAEEPATYQISLGFVLVNSN